MRLQIAHLISLREKRQKNSNSLCQNLFTLRREKMIKTEIILTGLLMFLIGESARYGVYFN